MIPPISPTQSAVVVPVLQLCEQRVSRAVAQDDLAQHGIASDELVGRIAEIVTRNLASGRTQRIMGTGEQRRHGEGETRRRGDMETSALSVSPRACVPASANASRLPGPSASLEAYVDQVITTYLREHRRVERLAARDEAAWNRLHQQLADRSYAMLLRRQVPGDRAVSLAADFAQDTCELIYTHLFPYDVPFDAWATLILKNCIRSPDLTDGAAKTLSLDHLDPNGLGDHFSLHDLLTDPAGDAAFERTEVQAWLAQAIACLPSLAQQQVITDTYLYQRDSQEIARRLGRSRQAVYNLRHRALRHLRRILAGERSKGEKALDNLASIEHGGWRS
jgi:RNA polymerase sigma factor (sigma-70 family)